MLLGLDLIIVLKQNWNYDTLNYDRFVYFYRHQYAGLRHSEEPV